MINQDINRIEQNYRIFLEPPLHAKESYRGIDRIEPLHLADPSVSEYWTWYVEQAADGGYIHDKEKAFNLIRNYKNFGENYELVLISQEVTQNVNKEFLGIEVADKAGASSLIKSGLLVWSNEEPESITGIIQLVCKYFMNKLNNNQLFHEPEDARLFLRVIQEIKKSVYAKNYIEPGYHYFLQYLYLEPLAKSDLGVDY